MALGLCCLGIAMSSPLPSFESDGAQLMKEVMCHELAWCVYNVCYSLSAHISLITVMGERGDTLIVFPGADGIFQQDNPTCHPARRVRHRLEEHDQNQVLQ